MNWAQLHLTPGFCVVYNLLLISQGIRRQLFFDLNYTIWDLFIEKLKLRGTQDTPSEMKVGPKEPSTIPCLYIENQEHFKI